MLEKHSKMAYFSSKNMLFPFYRHSVERSKSQSVSKKVVFLTFCKIRLLASSLLFYLLMLRKQKLQSYLNMFYPLPSPCIYTVLLHQYRCCQVHLSTALAPCLTVVSAECRRYVPVTCVCHSLQSSVSMYISRQSLMLSLCRRLSLLVILLV